MFTALAATVAVALSIYRLTHRPVSLENLRTLVLIMLSPGEEVELDDLISRIRRKKLFSASSVIDGLCEMRHHGLFYMKKVYYQRKSETEILSKYHIQLTRYGVEERIKLLGKAVSLYR